MDYFEMTLQPSEYFVIHFVKVNHTIQMIL